MNSISETIFRIVFGALWVFNFGLRLYFQRKVKGAGRYVVTNEKREKFFFLLFALAYILLPLYFITHWIDFAHVAMPIWLRWTGVAATCVGIGLFGWTHQVLGKNWTAIPALSENHELVTSGPYRYIRHPMYTTFFIVGFGFLFLSANWLIGVIYIGTLLLMYAVRISAEEKMMLDRFGDAYRQYMKTTGRLLPRLIK
jgi:protein-S-isoprenylcysteine O-methyltransferase Ste14